MTVVLDLRNAYFSIGASDSGSWLFRKRFGLGVQRTSDDFALLFRDVAAGQGLKGLKADMIAMSSVVPASCRAAKTALAETFASDVVLAGPGAKTGLKIRTDVPSELGADLVCMAMAANERFKRDLVIVDSSTALTFSAVNAKGEFLGAAIVPGLETAASSLRMGAAQLPQIDLSTPIRTIGRNTAQALSSGILNGYRGLMDGVIDGMAAEMGAEVLAIGSGTEAEPLVEPSRGFARYDPWLCLEGLLLLAQRNS